MALANMKVVKGTHWLTLSLIGSQFNFLNSIVNIKTKPVI